MVFIWVTVYYFFLSISSFFSKGQQNSKEKKIAVCLRRAFEFLGATYIKLGQIMSMRPDYFTKEICDELYKLFDKAEPLKFELIQKLLKERLKDKFELFESFEQTEDRVNIELCFFA